MVVKDILGHSNVTTTLDVYTRTFSNDLRYATNPMDGILGPKQTRRIVKTGQPQYQTSQHRTMKTVKRKMPKTRIIQPN